MKPVLRALSLLLSLPTVVLANDEAEWLGPITLHAQWETPAADIPASDFIEVPASKERSAEALLNTRLWVEQERADLKYLGLVNFQCSKGKSSYLIRAAYTNGGTGDFEIQRFGGNLLVVHASLGSATTELRSALVVCLDFQPTAVYGKVYGAL